MKPPRVCPDCGASLDAQEHCDCMNRAPVPDLAGELERKSDQLRQSIFDGIRKDAEIRELEAKLESAERRALDAETVLSHIPEYWKIQKAKDRIMKGRSEAV